METNKLPIDTEFMARVLGIDDGEYPIGEATSLELLGQLLDEARASKMFTVIKLRVAMDGKNYSTEGSWLDIAVFMKQLLSCTELPEALPA